MGSWLTAEKAELPGRYQGDGSESDLDLMGTYNGATFGAEENRRMRRDVLYRWGFHLVDDHRMPVNRRTGYGGIERANLALSVHDSGERPRGEDGDICYRCESYHGSYVALLAWRP